MSPDGISNKLLKEFAPIICHIYNQSLRKGFLPDPLKQSIAIVTPVPRPPPPQDITSDLRPISLTSCLIAKVIEEFTHGLLEQLSNDMDPRKYACHGNSTTHALSTSYKQFTKQWTHEISLLDFPCWLYEGFRHYRSQSRGRDSPYEMGGDARRRGYKGIGV